MFEYQGKSEEEYEQFRLALNWHRTSRAGRPRSTTSFQAAGLTSATISAARCHPGRLGPITGPTYNGRGNITALGTTTLTFDTANRATRLDGGTPFTYTRDASGSVIGRTIDGQTLWFSGPVTYATDKTTVVEAHLALPGGVNVKIPASGERMWSYSNLHGDVVALTNNTGVKQGATLTFSPMARRMVSY